MTRTFAADDAQTISARLRELAREKIDALNCCCERHPATGQIMPSLSCPVHQMRAAAEAMGFRIEVERVPRQWWSEPL